MKKINLTNDNIFKFLNKYTKKLEILKSKKVLIPVISSILLASSLFLTKKILEARIKEKVNLFELKNSYAKDIKLKFNKAVEIGILNYSLFDGIIFEDIKISNEEDFSNNKIFFSSERMDIQLLDVNETKNIKKIIFLNSKLKLNFTNTENEKFLKYIFELNPAEIEFKNFEIKVFKDEKEYFKTNDSFNLKLIRENSEYKWLMSDSRFNIKTIHAEGKISKLENEIFSKGRFELKKFKINNMVGFFNELTNLNPESGELEGILDFLNSPNETKLDGNINILNFRGEIFQFSNIGSKEFHLNSKFSYFKEITGKKIESHFKKTLSNPDFVLDELETISESNLKNISINFKIDDFKKLTSKLNLEDKFNVSGKLNLKLEFQETGKQSDYFLVNGLGEMKNFELVSVSPLIDIKKTDLKFFWNNQNLNASLTGKLFGEDVLFNLNSELKFQKELESKKIFISSNSDLEMKLDKLYIENFYSIFESIYTYIYDDIKERQEKMLPESYLVLDPFYKFYFEHAKLFFKIDFPSISKKTNEIDYGKFAFNSKMENGILSFNFTDLGKEKSLDLKSTIYIDRKIPTIDFRLNSDNLFLSHKLFDFCDVSFFADFLNFDFTFISSGNNFSDFYANKSIAGFFEANSGVFIKNGKYSDKVSIMENLKSNEVGSLKFNFNGYSQDLFINSLNLISKDFLINGNSSTQKGEQGYNFSGQIKNSQFGLSFYKKGDLCYKKK